MADAQAQAVMRGLIKVWTEFAIDLDAVPLIDKLLAAGSVFRTTIGFSSITGNRSSRDRVGSLVPLRVFRADMPINARCFSTRRHRTS